MNLNGIKALTLAACLGVALSSYAQSSDVAPSGSPPSGTTSSKSASKEDRALAKSVRRALSKAQGFDVSNVFVRARSGAVTLSGSVKTSDQITQAEQITRGVQGVNSVSNKLTLFHGGNG
jgi:hyperosmotically inducible protein